MPSYFLGFYIHQGSKDVLFTFLILLELKRQRLDKERNMERNKQDKYLATIYLIFARANALVDRTNSGALA